MIFKKKCHLKYLPSDVVALIISVSGGAPADEYENIQWAKRLVGKYDMEKK